MGTSTLVMKEDILTVVQIAHLYRRIGKNQQNTGIAIETVWTLETLQVGRTAMAAREGMEIAGTKMRTAKEIEKNLEPYLEAGTLSEYVVAIAISAIMRNKARDSSKDTILPRRTGKEMSTVKRTTSKSQIPERTAKHLLGSIATAKNMKMAPA